jgi:hypothetical protein
MTTKNILERKIDTLFYIRVLLNVVLHNIMLWIFFVSGGGRKKKII